MSNCEMNSFSRMSLFHLLASKAEIIDEDTAYKAIRIFNFLATCDSEDLRRIVDVMSLNDFFVAYLEISPDIANRYSKMMDDEEYDSKIIEIIVKCMRKLLDFNDSLKNNITMIKRINKRVFKLLKEKKAFRVLIFTDEEKK